MGATELLPKDGLGAKKGNRAEPAIPVWCSSRHTRRCCLATGVLGGLLAILGLLLLAAGKHFLREKVLHTMALSPGSKRLAGWLVPPVQAHLTGYGFHVTNPEEVMKGEKPILQEVGPFVYKAVTVKDSLDESTGQPNLEFGSDGETLTYRPRKFYYLDREQSTGGDPDNTYLTVPNVPLLTAFSKIRDMNMFTKPLAQTYVLANRGRGTPFINVTFSGLLWGYKDEMPCMKMSKPDECIKEVDELSKADEDTANEETDDGWEDGDWDSDDGWDDDEGWEEEDFKRRKKRSLEGSCVNSRTKREAGLGHPKLDLPNTDLRTLNFSALERPKAEFVNCSCEWGLFRDRNVTLRKPLKIHHGMGNLSMKGWVQEFDGKKDLGWWKKGSKCDQVGGQDTSTLPPGWTREQSLDFYTSLMCRRIKLDYEQDMEHAGLVSYRYVPSVREMASHTDPDPNVRNEENGCYCIDTFTCFKSGVFNMEPCKVTPDLPRGAPIALSYPHFYQADPSFTEAVIGLKPEKEKHQFYVDVVPEFGFPLAIRPRFQLNAIIRRDEDIEMMAGFKEETVVPFLWAQDGFSEPSEAMAEAIKFGLKVPDLGVAAGAVLLILGLGLLTLGLLWIFWQRKVRRSMTPESMSMSRL